MTTVTERYSALPAPGRPDLSPVFLAPNLSEQQDKIIDPHVLLAGAGNHEGKTILTMLMAESGDDYTSSGMNALLAERIGDPIKDTSHTNQQEWCVRSLMPSNLVTRARDGRKWQYSATTDANLFVPLGAFLLYTAAAHDVSLFTVFGMSQKRPGRNTPQALGIKTLEYIAQERKRGSLTYEELRSNLGFADTTSVYSVLSRLAGNGLITFTPHERHKSPTLLLTDRASRPLYPHAGLLTTESLRYMQERGSVSQDELLKHLAGLPLRERESQEQREARAKHCIEDLVRNRKLVRAGGVKATQNIPLTLSPEQGALIEDFVSGIRQYRRGDRRFLGSNEERGREMLRDSAFLSSSFSRYVKASAHMPDNGPSAEAVVQAAVTLLSGQEVTVSRVIQQIVAAGIRTRGLSAPTVRRALDRSVEMGMMTKKTTRGVDCYSVADQV